MKLYNISDVQKLCETIDRCEGKVAAVGEDGTLLNLKSKLTQFVALSDILGVKNKTISELEIVAEKPADRVRLFEYLIGA